MTAATVLAFGAIALSVVVWAAVRLDQHRSDRRLDAQLDRLGERGGA